MNTLLTKQPRFRCATAARFRQPRYPDRMAPAGYTGGGRSRAVSGVFCSKLPIQKRTGCRWPWVTQPWTARRAFAPFQNAIPAALEGGHVLAFRVVPCLPCRPGRLRGTCRRVQLRAQWTVGERFGRLGIRLLPQDTSWSVLALFKPAHLPVRRPLCQLVAAPCPRHRHFSHCHPQRRTLGNWWRRSDLNAQLPACKAGTLPLSYVPMCVWRVIERPFSVCRGGHCTWSAISRVSTPIVILCEGTAPLTSAGSDPATIALKTRLSGLSAVSSCCRVFLGRMHRLTGITRCGDTGGTVSAWFVTFPSGGAGRSCTGQRGVPVALRTDCVPHAPVSPGCQASFRFARKEKITREVQPEHFRW